MDKKKVLNNVVFLADSRQMGSFLKNKNSIDLILTGPPYWNEVVYSQDSGQLSNIPNYGDFLKELASIWENCSNLLKSGGILAFWVHDFFRPGRNNSSTYIPFHADIIKTLPQNLTLRNVIIWDRYLSRKKDKLPEMGSLGTRLQFIVICQKEGLHKTNHELITRSLVRSFWQPIWRKKTHPSLAGLNLLFKAAFYVLNPLLGLLSPIKTGLEKIGLLEDKHAFTSYLTECPEEVIEKIIEDYSQKNDTVLDPFLGSGTTMKIAQKMERNCIGVEINRTAIDSITKKVGKANFSLRIIEN